jgi:hypothetical protein
VQSKSPQVINWSWLQTEILAVRCAGRESERALVLSSLMPQSPWQALKIFICHCHIWKKCCIFFLSLSLGVRAVTALWRKEKRTRYARALFLPSPVYFSLSKMIKLYMCIHEKAGSIKITVILPRKVLELWARAFIYSTRAPNCFLRNISRARRTHVYHQPERGVCDKTSGSISAGVQQNGR